MMCSNSHQCSHLQDQKVQEPFNFCKWGGRKLGAIISLKLLTLTPCPEFNRDSWTSVQCKGRSWPSLLVHHLLQSLGTHTCKGWTCTLRSSHVWREDNSHVCTLCSHDQPGPEEGLQSCSAPLTGWWGSPLLCVHHLLQAPFPLRLEYHRRIRR